MPDPTLRSSAAHVFVADLAAPAIDEADAHHVLRVLRLRPDEVVTASDGTGSWRPCRLEAGGGLVPTGAVVSEPPALPLTIAFAPPKGDRPEWAVARLTELGVSRIIPLVASRSVVRWEDARWEKHHAKWQSVARQAAMQSRQVRLPTIDRPTPISALLTAPGTAGMALAVPGGPPPDLQVSGVLVGPEGGWAPEEEAMATATVGLGPGVLRTETAAVVAATLCGGLRVGIVRPARS